MIVEPPRMLTVEERTLLKWLVTTVDEHQTAYAAQVDAAKVVGHCECGCGSIHFAEGLLTDGGPNKEIIADISSRTPNHLVDVILWARGGRLSLLEIMRYMGPGPGLTPHPSWFEGTETSTV